MDLPIFQLNKKIFDQSSMSTSLTSEVLDIAELVGYCIHAIWTGTPNGQIRVQGSNDGTNFVNISTQNTGGSSGQYLLNVEHAHYRYLRLFYNRTGSTGALDCYVSGKRE